jgi:menaquinone-dependent protoporphyrinogen oxidase
MDGKVLVAYASKYGSTQEVAEAIADTLRDSGFEVDLQPMRKVRTLEGYASVVLGAAIYYGLWYKDALNLLSRNQDALAQRPVAIFALGPNSTDEKEMQGSRAQLDKELAKFPWLKPVVIEVFGGKYPARLRFPESLIASLPASPLHGKSASDVRDWNAIRAWANNLPQKLQPITSR